MSDFKKVSVIGLGYIGLPTAAILASKGIEVIGVDIDQHTVNTVNNGEIHIVEPGLAEVVKDVVANGKLRASVTPEEAQAFLIAVPTPFKGEKHEPDLSFIESAVKAIGPVLRAGNIVILESTSPVGATQLMAEWLSNERPDLTFPQSAGAASDIRIAHCPERVLPGLVMRELVSNDRIIGGMTERCSALAIGLYQSFVLGMYLGFRAASSRAALTENSFRDVNIAFANELSIISDRLDVNVWELISLSNRHPE